MTAALWLVGVWLLSRCASLLQGRIETRDEDAIVRAWLLEFGDMPDGRWPRLWWYARTYAFEVRRARLLAALLRDWRSILFVAAVLLSGPAIVVRLAWTEITEESAGPGARAAQRVGHSFGRAARRAVNRQRVAYAHALMDAVLEEAQRSRELGIVLGALHRVQPYEFPPESLN